MNEQSNSLGGRGTQHDQQRIQELGHDIGENAQALMRSLEGAARELEAMLREQVAQRPYGTLAAALTLGYVLGGGLPSRMTSLFLGIGSRLALAAMARELARQQLSANQPASLRPTTATNGLAY